MAIAAQGNVDMTDRQLRPFFCYYGGKWRHALKHYPAPQYETIVEPFAGGAGFSLHYASRKIILCERDPIIAEVWRYLIRVKSSEILSIRDIRLDEKVEDLAIPQEAKWLVGLWVGKGVARPRKSPSAWMREGHRPGSFWGERVRQIIATQVDFIRHWQIYNLSYDAFPAHIRATWFVDPPYHTTGSKYHFGSKQIDYHALADWCRSRLGQVIVCENDDANWLPFRKLANVKTMRKGRRCEEVVWLNSFKN